MSFKKMIRKIHTHHHAEKVISVVDNANFMTIFTMFMKDNLTLFLETTGKFIFFPLAAGLSLAKAVLSWCRVYHSRGQSIKDWGHALLDTFTAVGFSVAVILGLAASATFAPLILAGVTGVGCLAHAGMGGYDLYKAYKSRDKKLRKEYLNKALAHGVSVIIFGLATGAFICTMYLGKEALAAFGIAAGSVGLVYIIYEAGSEIKKQLHDKKQHEEMKVHEMTEEELSITKKLLKTLNVQQQPVLSQSPTVDVFTMNANKTTSCFFPASSLQKCDIKIDHEPAHHHSFLRRHAK